MPKLSKKSIDPKIINKYLDNLWSVITLLKDKSEIRVFFSQLLTTTEKFMLSKRLEITRRLLNNQDYDKIMKELKVTAGTVAILNNKLKTEGEGLVLAVEYLNALIKERERNSITRLDNLEKLKKPKLPAETFIYDASTAIIKTGLKKLRKLRRQKSAS